ncbi:MAG TPA: hypothetical protein VMW31_00690 [Devosiaceae bacterium]|nr:hypothetical protein [Devosiaceae bacterium]
MGGDLSRAPFDRLAAVGIGNHSQRFRFGEAVVFRHVGQHLWVRDVARIEVEGLAERPRQLVLGALFRRRRDQRLRGLRGVAPFLLAHVQRHAR